MDWDPERRELILFNSRVREWVMRFYEFPLLRRQLAAAGADLAGKAVLDAGCGTGFSTMLIERAFRPAALYAFDILSRQVDRARRRGLDAYLLASSVDAMPFPDGAFDAAFAIGVVHHVPDWRGALAELARVLKEGGILISEEPVKWILDAEEVVLGAYHPPQSRLPWQQMAAGIEHAGLAIASHRSMALGSVHSYVAIRQGVNGGGR